MTSVEELESPAEVSFESAYATDRATLYRALVLATGNRDIAVEAVDRAFARWQSKRASRRGDAALQVYAAAHRWAARRLRKPGRMIQGFRLQSDDVDATDDALLAHFDELDLTDRSLLTCTHYLAWDPDRSAAAIGIPAGEVPHRLDAAETRLARSAGITSEAAAARLPAALAGRAETLLEPLQRAEEVKAQARWRRIGVLAGGTVGAVVLAAGLGFAVQAVVDGGDDPGGTSAPLSSDGTSPDGTSAAASIFASDALIWERVPLPIRQGEVNSVTFGPAGFVAVGQDYSTGNGAMLTLLSEDGIAWDVGPGPFDGRNGWINQMLLVDDRYVAIGNTFSEFDGRDRPFLAISTDGADWASVELPIETEIEMSGRLINLYTYVQSIAAVGDRVLVLANQNAEFDPQMILQDALGDIELNNWSWSSRGIEIYTFEGQLEQVIPWDEVGIDEDTVAFITSGRPVIYSSTDLESWEAIPITGLGPNRWVNSLAAAGDSFAAVVNGDFGAGLMVSKDGAEWTEATIGTGFVNVNALANIGDRVIAVGQDADGRGAAWVTTDLETWEQIAIPFEGGWLHQVQVSSAGIAVVGEGTGGPSGPVDIPVGDLTVRVSSNGGFTVLDADGEEIAKIPSVDAIYGEDGTVELPDPETGEVLVSLDQRDIDQAWELHWRQFELERQGAGPEYVVLISETGDDWTVFSLADEIGNGFYPNAVALGTDAIVMTGWQDEGFAGGVVGGSGVSIWVGTAP